MWLMVQDQGVVLREGWNCVDISFSKKQHRRSVNLDGVEADESYKMFLGEMFDFAQGNDQSDLVELSKEKGSAGGLENKESADSAECDGDVSQEDDPDYELFFGNLKPCGNAYAHELKSNGCSVITQYEDKDTDEFHASNESRRKLPKSFSLARELENHLPGSGLADGSDQNDKQKPEAKKKKKSEGPNDREDERCDGLKEGKSQRDGCLGNTNPPRKRGRPRKVEKGEEKVQLPNQEKMDKVYVDEFMSKLKIVEGVPVYRDEDGNECRYDESNPSSGGRMTMEPSKKRLKSSEKRGPSDEMDIEASDKRPPSSNMNIVGSAKPPLSNGRKTPETTSKRIKLSDKRVSSDAVNVAVSDFRKKAMEIILMPYDPKECSGLLKQAKLRKPVMHHRETRGRSTSFPDEVEVDKSYLDRYEDLRKEIEAAQRNEQPHKVLHLLRGLFFYLKCLCMDGSFIPWKDKSWLEAVRKSILSR